ncbi:MAG: fimbrillin family protein [Bacteroides sp.]|nr:fimbrillin family protein [Bacteroides sp.]
MKGIKLFTPPLASLLLLAACGETDDAEHRTTPIGFSTRVTETGTTRAEEITTANLTSMGILASFTGQTNFDGANVTPGFMYNQPVTKNGTTWTYTPLKYWPNNPEDKVSFFAYAPYNATGVTLSGADHTGYPYLTYEVPAAEANQTDLLASLPLLDKNGENLTFTMKHALTKVNIIVKDGESDDTPKVLNSFTLKAKSQGRLTYTTNGFNWNTNGSPTTTYTITQSNFNVVKGSTTTIATLYLIPDKTDATFSMEYTVHGTIETGGIPPVHTVTVTDKPMPEASEWKAGEEVNYTITIKKAGVEIDADTGNTWEEDTNNYADIKTYIAGDLKLGDYYYSDGTYSDGGLRAVNMTTGKCLLENPVPDPESGKTCVGIVFYAGKHPTDDCTYTTKDGDNMENLQGYAVSLDNLGEVFQTGGWILFSGPSQAKYVVGTSTDLNDYKGYTNTHLIESTAIERGIWSTSYFHLPYKVLNSFTPLAPSATSGWYMPSAGQVQDLYKYRIALRSSLTKLGKKMTGSTGGTYTYWTSTEVDANNAYKFDYFNGDNGHLSIYGKTGRDTTRPVFTF